jgi:carbamoyl-phosphate synthase large subunit
MSERIKILFLGAGKRLSLLENFVAAAVTENVTIELLAVENKTHVPISGIARIVQGPGFKEPAFESFLYDTIATHSINMVIPNMDAATVALAKCAAELKRLKCRPVVSDYELCRVMEDKILAQEWFIKHGIPTPQGAPFPCIAKHRRGFGSRDQCVAYDQQTLDAFFAHRKAAEYIIQPYLSGTEYTVDAYVDGTGRTLGALSRKRLEVSAGEVDVSQTHRHREVLELTGQILAVPGWRGPLTFQFIVGAGQVSVIEANPRFGGGVTHSIHCGLEMPRWLIREYFDRPTTPFDAWQDGSIMTRCRRDVFL